MRFLFSSLLLVVSRGGSLVPLICGIWIAFFGFLPSVNAELSVVPQREATPNISGGTQSPVRRSSWFLSRVVKQGAAAFSWLEERGVSVGATYTFDYSLNGVGGIRRRVTSRGFLDLHATWRLKPLLGIDEGTVFISYQNFRGRDASRDVGDLQIFSNIDASERSQIAELWYEQWLFNKRLRFKIGRMQADSEFAFVENGGEFIHSSQGHSPTIFVMPVYPDAASGVALFVYPTESLYASFGVYDGAARRGVHTGVHGPETLDLGDLFFIGEVGRKWRLSGGLPGRIGIGGWGHHGTFERLSGGTQAGTVGAYVALDQMLWRENPELDDDMQGIAAFLQYGYADKAVSELAHHLGAGLTWTGVLSNRDSDVFGLGANWVRLSNHADFRRDYELALELFYKIAFPWQLVLKPDLQYIINPSGGNHAAHALVGTLRVEWSF